VTRSRSESSLTAARHFQNGAYRPCSLIGATQNLTHTTAEGKKEVRQEREKGGGLFINAIASMVCHAHRMGRKEAHDYLKQFVLEQMRVPDWPHYPMNDLRKMTPPPLTPTPDKWTIALTRKGRAREENHFPCVSCSRLLFTWFRLPRSGSTSWLAPLKETASGCQGSGRARRRSESTLRKCPASLSCSHSCSNAQSTCRSVDEVRSATPLRGIETKGVYLTANSTLSCSQNSG
jgi:hypothetical protein